MRQANDAAGEKDKTIELVKDHYNRAGVEVREEKLQDVSKDSGTHSIEGTMLIDVYRETSMKTYEIYVKNGEVISEVKKGSSKE